MSNIDLVILDQDGTIYNWIDYYANAFRAMLKELEKITGRDQNELKSVFKSIHQEHGTSEYAFSLQEFESRLHHGEHLSTSEVMEKYESAVQAFRDERDNQLELYDNVESTLSKLKENGKTIVAYTDARLHYASRRLSYLGIEQYFDGLVALEDHETPPNTNIDLLRNERWNQIPDIEKVKKIEVRSSKPNTDCVMNILNEYHSTPEKTIYVGDSLTKDILPAQQCDVHDIYAKYGKNHGVDNFNLLVDISHWTEDEIQNARELSELDIEPSYIINSFDEVLDVLETIEV